MLQETIQKTKSFVFVQKKNWMEQKTWEKNAKLFQYVTTADDNNNNYFYWMHHCYLRMYLNSILLRSTFYAKNLFRFFFSSIFSCLISIYCVSGSLSWFCFFYYIKVILKRKKIFIFFFFDIHHLFNQLKHSEHLSMFNAHNCNYKFAMTKQTKTILIRSIFQLSA